MKTHNVHIFSCLHIKYVPLSRIAGFGWLGLTFLMGTHWLHANCVHKHRSLHIMYTAQQPHICYVLNTCLFFSVYCLDCTKHTDAAFSKFYVPSECRRNQKQSQKYIQVFDAVVFYYITFFLSTEVINWLFLTGGDYEYLLCPSQGWAKMKWRENTLLYLMSAWLLLISLPGIKWM